MDTRQQPLKLYAGYIYARRYTESGDATTLIPYSCYTDASLSRAQLEKNLTRTALPGPMWAGYTVEAKLVEIPIENIQLVYESQIDFIDADRNQAIEVHNKE